jgi:Protein of unknown function (DUF4238)
MSTSHSRVHHYVPQWYQRRFFKAGQSRFYYLDLHPETVCDDGVHRHRRRSLLRWGPARCFCADELYTVKLGDWLTDEIERRFFGAIDPHGQHAVEALSEFEGLRRGFNREAFAYATQYMDAQRMRTPRGLDRLQSQIDICDRNQTLMAMQILFQLHTTMWSEGVREIVRARDSPTKFISTDEPVTFYNARVFPESKVGRYPGDVGLDKIGTRTLFPLGIDSCLIITHVQLVRNPWSDMLASRLNARAYQPTMMSLLDVQFGRELTEDEVLRVNLILKRRATRYLAAAEEEWLYPEKKTSIQHWSKLDDDWFLFPHLWKVSFVSGIVAGYSNGRKWAADEYGYHPGDPNYDDQRRRQREWDLHHKAKEAWSRKRAGCSVAHVDDGTRGDLVGDSLMQEYLDSVAHRAVRNRTARSTVSGTQSRPE